MSAENQSLTTIVQHLLFLSKKKSFYGVVQAAARASAREFLVSIPPRDSSPSPFGGPLPISGTPEALRTPRATLSLSSVFSDPSSEHGRTSILAADLETPVAKTPRASVSLSASVVGMVTPTHNSCMTVPVMFTPKHVSVNASSKKRGKRKGVEVVEEEEEEREDNDEEVMRTGSPKRRKKNA